MPGERRLEFACGWVPQMQKSVLRSTGQHAAVHGAKRQAQYRGHVPQRERDPAGEDIPQRTS